MGKNQHVIRHKGKWAVKGYGNKRVTSIHSRQIDAINAARRIARNKKSKVIIESHPYRKKKYNNKNSNNNDLWKIIIIAFFDHNINKTY